MKWAAPPQCRSQPARQAGVGKCRAGSGRGRPLAPVAPPRHGRAPPTAAAGAAALDRGAGSHRLAEEDGGDSVAELRVFVSKTRPQLGAGKWAAFLSDHREAVLQEFIVDIDEEKWRRRTEPDKRQQRRASAKCHFLNRYSAR